MRIAGILRDNTRCNDLRIEQPLLKMYQKGLADVITCPENQLGDEEHMERVLGADVIVFQRPASAEWFKFIKTCQEHGKIIVTDYDDDPFNTSPLNPFYKFTGTKEVQYTWENGEKSWLWKDGQNDFHIDLNIERNDMFRSCFRRSDMITTSTDVLRETFLKLNDDVTVLPNLVNFDVYKRYEMKKNEVRIGYQGGCSHYEDLYMIKPYLKKILDQNDNVKFVYFGDSRFKGFFKDLPQDKVEWNDWVNLNAFPYKLSLLNLDIGLAPLVDNEFNRNKSALKFFDYSTQGVATIASDVIPYSPIITHGQTGLLVNGDNWVDAANELIRNKEMRDMLSKNAYDYVYENHNADTKAHLWADAYKSLVNKDITEEIQHDLSGTAK